jgi:hypothetical protein
MFGTTPEAVRALNQLPADKNVKIGEELFVPSIGAVGDSAPLANAANAMGITPAPSSPPTPENPETVMYSTGGGPLRPMIVFKTGSDESVFDLVEKLGIDPEEVIFTPDGRVLYPKKAP